MNTRRLGLLGFAAISAFSLQLSALADVPNLINYQGRLRDNLGLPLNGTVNVQVALFTNETAGAAVFAQNLGPVPLTNGVYSFAFGGSDLPTVLSHPEVWLGVTVDGNVLTPRQRLLAVPFAVVAGTAVVAQTVQGENLFVHPGSGFVGVGTKQPATPLHVLDELGGSALRATRNSDVAGIIVGGQGGGRHLIVNDVDRARWALATGGYGLSFQNDWNTNWTTSVQLSAQGDLYARSTVQLGNTSTYWSPTGIGEIDFLLRNGIHLAAHAQGAGWSNYSAHTGCAVYAGMPGAWGTGYLGVRVATNWTHYSQEDAARFGHDIAYFRGSLGIGTTTPSYKLHVNGSVAGVGAYQNVSDARLKKNVTTLTNALATVEALRGVRFDWRTEEHPDLNFEAGSQLGLIAQEVEQVLPEAVSQDAQGTRSVAYSKLIPVLIEAIKAQQREIEELKQKVAGEAR